MMKPLTNRLSRREFLKLVSTGIAVGGVSQLIGCVPGAAPPPAQPSAPKEATAPAVTESIKVVHFAMSGKATSADTADPAFNTTQHDGRLISAVYEQLAQFDESLKAVPVLAESWEPNDKADVWTFNLRRGVTFHDGSKFTARDVVYSYRRLLDPEVASPGASNLSFIDPDGIEAVDDYTVRFKLKQPNVDLPLSTIFRQAYIVPEGATGDDLKATANGTGPFKLKEFTPGETPTVFVKNENYWQPGIPKIDVLELTSILSPSQHHVLRHSGEDRLTSSKTHPSANLTG